jgi:hypothetical protein
VINPVLDRQVFRRLAVLRHVEEVSGNVAMTCRYFGISRQVYYKWLRRYESDSCCEFASVTGLDCSVPYYGRICHDDDG